MLSNKKNKHMKSVLLLNINRVTKVGEIFINISTLFKCNSVLQTSKLKLH